MIEKKELSHIILAIILMSIVLSLFNNSITLSLQGLINYLTFLAYSIIIFSVWIFGKKLTAKILYIDIKHKIFEFQRYWFPKNRKFPKPIPIGLILPLLIAFISTGLIKMFTFLQFESTPLTERVIKKRGKQTWREIMEWDLGLIAFYGIISLLILSILANNIGAFDLAKYTIFFALWNLIPFGQLDGTKIFFGSRPGTKVLVPLLYLLTLILTTITLGIVLF